MSEENTEAKERTLFDKIMQVIVEHCQQTQVHLSQLNFEVELVQRHLWKNFDNQVASMRSSGQSEDGDKQEQEVSSPEVVEDKA